MRRKHSGFTFIELLIVIAAIVIGAIAIPDLVKSHERKVFVHYFQITPPDPNDQDAKTIMQPFVKKWLEEMKAEVDKASGELQTILYEEETLKKAGGAATAKEVKTRLAQLADLKQQEAAALAKANDAWQALNSARLAAQYFRLVEK